MSERLSAVPVGGRTVSRLARRAGGGVTVRHAPGPEPHSLMDARAVVRDESRLLPRPRRRSAMSGVPGALVAADLLVLVAVSVVAEAPVALHLAFAATVLLTRAGLRLYRRRLHLSILDELPRCLASVLGVGGVLLVVASLPAQPGGTPRELLALVAAFFALSAVLHAGVLAIARHVRRRRGPAERTLIIGAGRVGRALACTMLDHPDLGLLPVGFADPDSLHAADDLPLPVVSTDPDALSETLRLTGATTAVMAFSAVREAQVVDAVITAHQSGCDVLIVPRMFELHHDGPDVERIRGVPLIRLRPDPTLRPTWWLKRTLDVLTGASGLLLVSPLLLVLAVLVLLDSGRPVLFWQERVGLDGKVFRLAKLRSMRPRDEVESQTHWTIADDPRVSRLGRFLRRSSLDELPQLWNMVRGEMSLVGPRPERPTFVRQFSDEHDRYWARHRVPVGLTGLAQVNGLRGDTSIPERARYDNYYIANWSLWLDIRILLLTVREVLRGGGR